MRDDPAAPGTSDEGGPVAHPRSGRIELGYPFEDADVLADLFLNDGPTVAKIGPGGLVATLNEQPGQPSVLKELKPTPSAAPMATKTEVEVLLVGHLPVLGSAWVLQYAKHVAQRTGMPVGLVRLSGGEASIDLTLPPSQVPPQTGPMPSIAEAVRFVAGRTGRWIVRLDENADRTTAADAAMSIRAADRVTVLTSADEAAIVGCYRVIKTLEPGESTPHLHVAVMGAQPDRAEEAAAKLSRAAEKFLNSTVTSEACGAKITPGSSVSVYRGRPNATHADLISLLRGGPAPSESPRPAAEFEPILEAEPIDESVNEADALIGRGEVLVEPTPSILGEPAREAVSLPVAPVVAPQPRIEPKPAEAVALAASAIETRGLARHLTNLDSLATRCPYAPEVELAVDPGGRLHLIARSAADPGATLGALTTAKAWAEAHGSLMSMAHPTLRNASAICHLMTDVPKNVRRLGDTDLKLHLLTAPPGTDAEQSGWVCVELN